MHVGRLGGRTVRGVFIHSPSLPLHASLLRRLIEEGGDWDRRNRLKTYEGLYALSVRDFRKAATCFFDTMATFTSTELMDYRTFVKYACFSCLVALGRSDMKSKVGVVYMVGVVRRMCS